MTPSLTLNKHDLVQFYDNHCTYLPAMLGWFIFSALLTSYNKVIFGGDHMKFPCPLFLTSIHFGVQWLFAHVSCQLFPVILGTDRVKQMSWKEWFSISVPCGLTTSCDIGLSNLSIVFLSISFYTMVKSSTPIFVLGWAYILGIERITWRLVGVICVIAIGEFFTVFGEEKFVLNGFIMCLSASVISGARWTMVQLKLQNMNPPMKTTIATMRLLSPSMFWSMLIISAIVERPWNVSMTLQVVGLGLLGGCLAIAMILCEFYLILHASALILMIGGVIKEMTTILIGVSFFGDKLNATNVTGFCIVFLGVILYKLVFHLEKKDKLEAETYEQVHGKDPEEYGEREGHEATAVSDRASLELVDRFQQSRSLA